MTNPSSSAVARDDANGNTLSDAQGRSFTWDFENRLTQVVNPGVGTTSFRYDPFGRRIQKSGPLGTTNYVYDTTSLIDELDGTGGVLAGYTHSLDIDEPLADIRSGTANYYQADGLGSITSLTNPYAAATATYGYDAFGNLSASTGSLTNPFRYTGREFDPETGLYYSRARYLDLSTGRFVSEDPARRGTTFYAYARNKPVNRTDPLGLWDTDTHHNLIWNALKPCGVSNHDIWLIQEESDFVDLIWQLPDDAYKHGMKAPWESAQDAIQDSNGWIQQNLNLSSQMYQQMGPDTASASNPTITWTTPFGDALHTIMDSTSPMHRHNGTPISWPILPNALHHGSPSDWPGSSFGSGESWGNMTPGLMQENIDMIQAAYEQVTGHKCGCK